MNTKQLVLGILVLVSIVAVSGIAGYVSIVKYEKQTQINAQTEIERTKIEQEAMVTRTKERMNLIPWYKGGENKKKG